MGYGLVRDPQRQCTSLRAWRRCVVKCVELRGVASKVDVVEDVGLHGVA